MNELEKEIEERVNFVQSQYYDKDCASLFQAGCNFILEKNLPVLFAIWFLNNCYRCRDGYLYNYEPSRNPTKTVMEFYDYWLNNEYGKEKS